eukprot:scaffold112715_cov63-Phaeocystis_antarctica.AAC.3
MYKNVQRHTAKAAHGEGRTRHPRIRYVAQLLQIRFGSQPRLFPVFVANNTSRKRLIVERPRRRAGVSCNPISTMLHCKNLSTRLLVAVTACQPPPPARPSHGSAADRPPGAKGTGPTTGELASSPAPFPSGLPCSGFSSAGPWAFERKKAHKVAKVPGRGRRASRPAGSNSRTLCAGPQRFAGATTL